MATARWLLTAVLWGQSIALHDGVSLLLRELDATAALRLALLSDPGSAVRRYCTQPPSQRSALINCRREVAWWHRSEQPREICSSGAVGTAVTPRRYRLQLSCTVQAWSSWELPLLSTTVFR